MNKTSIHKKIKPYLRRMKTPFGRVSAQFGSIGTQVLDAFKGVYQHLTSGRFSQKEQVFFSKRLSFLITAGVPILESLHIVRQQTQSKAQLTVVDTIIHDVSNGQALSKSIAKFPKMFGKFAVNIIKVGETSGTLSQNLDYLAEELKKKQALHRRVIGALIYPALITVATLCITAFLMLYLFPKIMPIFLSMHMALPLSTRMVISVSTFFHRWGLYVIGIIFLCVVGAVVLMRKKEGFRGRVHRYMLGTPFVGSMSRIFNLANSTRTLGLLLKSGIPLSGALAITAETSGNVEYQKQWHSMKEAINRGQKMSLQLAKSPHVFPHIFVQMVSVGEKSGSLSDTLIYVSEFYEQEMDDLTKSLSGLVEPALMIFMGLLIGLIAISIITPIYGITQNLHP
ncbi:MAG: hypothetical protein RLZZ347_421 [Candidatus Parcubacteria bacterium]|jgi:type IV pilus assembly protein PilC